jgi:P27 family predicted phage terminase small subunit
MGTRGPRPELPELKSLKGNPGKRKIEPAGVVALGEPFTADHLHSDAKACVELIRQVMPPGIYRRADSLILASFATAWALHKKAVEQLRATGEYVIEGARGPQPGPWVKILNDQAKLMASLGDRLGLDPKSRAGLKLPDEKPKSKFDGLVGGASKAH